MLWLAKNVVFFHQTVDFDDVEPDEQLIGITEEEECLTDIIEEKNNGSFTTEVKQI